MPDQAAPQSEGIELELEMLRRLRTVMARSRTVRDKGEFIAERVRGKSVLDLGCIGHSAQLAMEQGDRWLHSVIARGAASCTGVDYLKDDAEVLNRRGWNIVCQDITRMDLGRKFDVVVAADVIEHLSDLNGFFLSVRKHLADGGELIVSTPNALGLGQVLYVLLRGAPLVNPDHACWFDPKSLIQLAGRRPYGFVPSELAWIRKSWSPSGALLHGTGLFGVMDFYTGRWSPLSRGARAARALLQRALLAPLDWPLRLFPRRYFSSDFVLVFRAGGE